MEYELHVAKRQALIEALKTATTVKEACEAVDVPIATYKHWMNMAVTHGGEYYEFRKSVMAAFAANPNSKKHHKQKYTVAIDGEHLSLKQVAQKHGIDYNMVRKRYVKHLQNPVEYPIETLVRPVKKRVKNRNKVYREGSSPFSPPQPGKGVIGILESIADSLQRIADFFDRV